MNRDELEHVIRAAADITKDEIIWLRSMRGERPQYRDEKPYITILDRILVVMAVLAFALFEIWFFFYASRRSPPGRRTRRDPPEATIAQWRPRRTR